MKKRLISLLLVLALVLSLCAVSAVAGEEPEEPAETAASTEAESGSAETSGGETAADGEAEEEAARDPVYLAGPDKEPAVDSETGELLEEVTIVPDEVGTITFANLERRMRENNLQLNAIEENILIIEDIDYDELYEDIRKQLNDIAGMQWGVVTTPAEYLGGEYTKDKSYDQLDQAYDALRDTFEAIKDGELQEDNKDAVWQLNSLEDQIVMGGEALYVALVGLEIQEAGLQRQLTAMNRTVEEMELRYTMGQISALQLSGDPAHEHLQLQAAAGTDDRRGADRRDRAGPPAGGDCRRAGKDEPGRGPADGQGQQLRPARSRPDPGGGRGGL